VKEQEAGRSKSRTNGVAVLGLDDDCKEPRRCLYHRIKELARNAPIRDVLPLGCMWDELVVL
jgi:hypothetical protein